MFRGFTKKELCQALAGAAGMAVTGYLLTVGVFIVFKA
jgi:hypothetical protein